MDGFCFSLLIPNWSNNLLIIFSYPTTATASHHRGDGRRAANVTYADDDMTDGTVSFNRMIRIQKQQLQLVSQYME